MASPDTQSEDVVTLQEFHVSAVPDGSYMATESTSGTRVATQIINLPYSIQVLTEDFVRDFQLFDLDEQAPFVSSMAPGDPAQGGGGGTRLRGFHVPYFRNGFYRRQAPDSNSIARTEIVKGPQSAVYGRVSPGGVVNYISKKPQTRFGSGLNATLGTHDYQRIDGHVTGPLIQDKLFYRVDLGYYDFERPTDFWYNRTFNASGSLTYRLTRATSITFEYEHTNRIMNDYQNFTRWYDAAGVQQGSVWDIPDRRLAKRLIAFNSSGAHRRTDRLNDSAYLQIEHRFSPDLSLRANIGHSTREFERNWAGIAGDWDMRNNGGAGGWRGNRTMNRQTIDDLQVGSQIDLTKVWHGAGRQRSLLTFDLFEDDTKQKTWQLTGARLDNELAALGLTTVAQRNAWKKPDPFDPNYGQLPMPGFKPELWPMTENGTWNLYRFYYGGLFNHTAEFMNGRLALTGSIRHDWADYKRQQPLSSTANLQETTDDTQETTYSVGANYHIIPRKLVGYVSYGTSFDPAPQADPNTGVIHGNKTSSGVEVGLKGLLLEDAFSYTLSAYKLEQENEVTDNPDWLNADSETRPTLPRYVPGATTRGEGVSLDLSGRVTDNLTLLGNIAWTDIWISAHASNPSLVGTRPLSGQNVPGRSAAIAARYNFGSGPLKGLRLGLNYQYYTSYLRLGGGTGFYLPGKNEVGLLASYSHKVSGRTLSYSLNVTNLFDREQITVAAFAPPGREVRFTTSLRF